jgi:hypothetical protein
MKRLFLSVTLLLAIQFYSKAQYPVVPKEVEDSASKAEDVWKKRSDENWKLARVDMEAEEKKGKPFIPWAEKPSDLPQATVPAFPGAEGGGKFSFGGRGGKVLVVTTLKDDGPGSFRWACEQGGARTVVFNVAGIIQLKSPVIIRAPYITIAGQSAPGDGVCIAGESVWMDTHDIVIRYMRFRRGSTDVTRRDDALGGNPVGNVIIDHVSASWGLDENLSIYRHVYKGNGKDEKLPTVNVTIQNSIFSEALDRYNHAFGSTIGGLNSTFLRNLWSSNISRSPSVGMYGDFGFANNVVFNWWNRTADGGDHRSLYTFINNYYKPGPITPKDKPIAYRILKPETGRDSANRNNYGKAYVSGNFVEGNERVSADNWAGGVQPGDDEKVAPGLLEKIKANQSMIITPFPITDAKTAYAYVLENAGATLPKRDAVDKRIVEQVKTGVIQYNPKAEELPSSKFVKRRLPADSYKQGVIIHPDQVGGYPEYKGTAYTDSDKDGIPDDWEKKNGLNPNDAADSGKYAKNKSGYTNIEEYLNSLVPASQVTIAIK